MLEGLLRLALCLAAVLTPPARSPVTPRLPQAEEQDAAGRVDQRGYPVRLDGEVVLWVRTGLGPIGAEERARLASERLERIAEDPFYSPGLLRVEITPEEGRVYYRDEQVALVNPEDTVAGQTLQQAVAEIVRASTEAIASYRERRMPQRRWRAALSLLAATLLAAALVLAARRMHRRLVARVEQGRQSALALKLKESLGVPPEKLSEYQRRALRLGLRFSILVIVLAWLQAAFSVVPLTRGYALAFLRYLLAPITTLWLSFLEHVGDLFFILVVLVLTWNLLKLMRWVAAEAHAGSVSLPGVAPEFALPLYKILRLVVIAFAAMIVYPYVPGSSSGAFKGISLFAGALFTLGASGTAGNFIGGIVLVFMGLYRLGDRIRLGEVMGDVVEMNLMVTRVRTPKNEVISLPNSAVLGGQVVNYSARARREGVILHTSVTIGYDTPWRQVHELLLAAARATDGLLEDPAAYVLQTGLGDFYVGYELNAYTRRPGEMDRIYSDLHQHIQDEFNRAGVQIMSPHYINDPPRPKIVPPERSGAAPQPRDPRV